jgi:hypothetical protein
MDFEIPMAQSIAERFGKRRNPRNYAGLIPVLQEKQAVLTKYHGKTQGNFFMGEKIEVKTGIEERKRVARRVFFSIFR